MSTNPQLSVIIPYGYPSPDLESAIESAQKAQSRIEIILVTHPELLVHVPGQLMRSCHLVESRERGRGQFCCAGARVAKADIVLFLHADTLLPDHWDQSILQIMTNPDITGGGFSTRFRTGHWMLRYIRILYDLFALCIREFWGDRALFIRRDILIENLHQIDISIMEDVEMSKIIRKNGKLKMLPDVVSTSDLHFSVKGYFRHILEVLYFRISYALGVSPDTIYTSYYRGSVDLSPR